MAVLAFGQVIARTTIDVPRTLGAFLGFLFWFPIPLERGFLSSQEVSYFLRMVSYLWGFLFLISLEPVLKWFPIYGVSYFPRAVVSYF